ncbi:proline--tRNA ligase [Patescibacteria group bacterium]|nr:proline--tRNA ligase [Patescibacteria group bacterium]
MRYSRLFGKTTKTVSHEATAASHKLLLQGGFIRMLAAGRYSFLPLGFSVSQKIENIIREEVEKTGAQEVIVPTLHPIELWQQANRDKKFGSAMMRVTDRNGAEFTLGATAEVVMLDLVKQFSVTYKDLPINIFQFSQKFRDEARATGGLLRTREFVMKDGYSFHVNEADLKTTYQQYWDAYVRIAQRLELPVTIVESDNGAIGGSISHEFMVETPVGEDTVVKCHCGYAANLEKATFIKEAMNPGEKELPLKEVEAVRGATMEDGVQLHHLPLWQQIKDVMYVDDNGRFVLAIIRGDFMVNETKLKNALGINELRHATDEEIVHQLHSVPGFISPVAIKDNLASGVELIIIADDSLSQVVNMYGGSNRKNVDLTNVNFGRDYRADLTADIAQAEAGFICPKCQKWQLQMVKAVEFGNIFNIGFTYSDPMNGTFVDKDGTPKKLYMGSYGIGIGRAIATIVELHHDDKGIIWPREIAPYQVHLVALDLFDEKIRSESEKLYQQLLDKNIDVLFDDREGVTAGEKFADADLIGIPARLVISKRSLDRGGIEVKQRHSSESAIIALNEIPSSF